MRRSKFKHPLAVLRTTLELHQKQMAKICGCEKSMVKQIESGQAKKLSVAMARRIVGQTGVNFRWLTQGRPKDPILDVFGRPYSKRFYDELCVEYESERRVSKHDPLVVKFSTYSTLGRYLLFMLGAVEHRKTLSFITQVHSFLDELDAGQGFKLSPRLAKELSKAILDETMRVKPDPLRFVVQQGPVPELGVPGETRFNASAYEEAERKSKEMPLIALLKRFGDEVESLIAQQRKEPNLCRSEETDQLPQLMTGTAMLLPLPTTKLRGKQKRDYRHLAREALAKEEVIRLAQELRSAGVLTAKVIEQLKRAKVPSQIVACLERLRNLKGRKIRITRSSTKPAPAPKADLKAAALREAQRSSDWSELTKRLDKSELNDPEERVVCLRVIRTLGLEEKLRRVLATAIPVSA